MDSSLSPPVDTPGAQLAFLKNASSDKKVTRDGNPPKRRGPKPDSRPALTRRQELNRQAQRTHRERKELYIKALEDEVLRLKEIYSSIAQDKERLAGENRQLRQLLIQQQQGGTMPDNGGQGPSPGPSSGGGGGGPSSGAGGPGGFGGGLGGPGGPGDDTASNPSAGYSGSANGSYGGPAPSSHTSAYTPPSYGNRSMTSPTGHSPSSSHAAFQSQPPQHMHQHKLHQQPPHVDAPKNPAIDYEQAGIDFVLTLEKPCMDHLPWLVEHSAETGSSVCGHALMASCPPRPFFDLQDNVPFGDSNVKASIVPGTGTPCEPVTFAPGTAPGQRTWELSKADLSTLLALSAKLDLDGEITPVMAWGMILAHPRLGELTLHDFGKLTEELAGKIRCYGFGAVMEEFEVRDALENVLPTKPDALVSAGAGAGAGAFSFNAPVQRPLQGQQHQAMPFITNTFAGDAHNGMPSAHAAFGQLSAPSAMYTPDMIQPGYAVAI